MKLVDWLRLVFLGEPIPRPETQAFGDVDHAPLDRAVLGAHAKALVHDPVLSLAFERVERDLIATWRATQLGDSDSREACYDEVWALEAVKAKLRAFMGDLQLIQAEQKRKEAAEQRVRERRERTA